MLKELVLGYCPQGNGNSIKPFDEVFSYGMNIAHEGNIQKVDAVVFWGGQDIHPSYYGEEHHSKSQAFQKPTARDEFEWKAMRYCQLNNIPMIGVCRGAQMLCAFAGGKLIQHADGHNCGAHPIVTKDGEVMQATSAHHQMMFPFDIPHEMLAWSQKKLSTVYQNGQDMPIEEMDRLVEPEIVYFPQIRGLAIQGHPEWMKAKDRVVQYFNELIIDKLLLKYVEEAPL